MKRSRASEIKEHYGRDIILRHQYVQVPTFSYIFGTQPKVPLALYAERQLNGNAISFGPLHEYVPFLARVLLFVLRAV
jgi:hypothetical protein